MARHRAAPRRHPGPFKRGLTFIGGLLCGVVLVGGGVVALSVSLPESVAPRLAAVLGAAPVEERAAAEDAPEPEPEETVGALAGTGPQGLSGAPAPAPAPSAGAPGAPGRPATQTPTASLALTPLPGAGDSGFGSGLSTSGSDSGSTELGAIAALPPSGPVAPPSPVPSVGASAPAFRLDGPALDINARPFDGQGRPLMAVILTDAGASTLARETLLSLPAPLTLAIAPGDPFDIDLAGAARATGYEVLAQLGIGEGATIASGLSDVEIADRAEAAMEQLSMSVGALPITADGAPVDDRVARALIAVLERNGFAFVGASDEAPARNFAGAFGVPFTGRTTTVPTDVTPDDAYAALTATAEAANANGTAVLSGPASRAMLEALLLWSVDNAGGAVVLAPLSAVIKVAGN
ncbi:MAG: divergent polysaccharide deacetylase family protein [Pseudomonadota bacterium]